MIISKCKKAIFVLTTYSNISINSYIFIPNWVKGSQIANRTMNMQLSIVMVILHNIKILV